MNRLMVISTLVGSTLLGAWLAYGSTPISMQAFIPNMAPLKTWHASVVGAMVVNRDRTTAPVTSNP